MGSIMKEDLGETGANSEPKEVQVSSVGRGSRIGEHSAGELNEEPSSLEQLSVEGLGYTCSVNKLPAMQETWVRSPGEGNGNPLQYSYLENSMDRGTWQATVHGVAKSRT